MSRFVWFLLVCGLLAVTIAALWFTTWPLGVAGEWTWARLHYRDQSPVELLLRWSRLLVAGIAYLLIVARGLDSRHARRRWRVLVSVLLAGSIGWSVALQLAGPEPAAELKPLLVLHDPGSSGYFTEARRIEDAGDFFRNYATWIRSGDSAQRILHQGTHPPGLIAINLGLQRLMRASATLQACVLSTLPDSIRTTFLAAVPEYSGTGSGSWLAALWAAVVLTQVLAMLPVPLIFSVVRLRASDRSAWIAAALWPLVPAIHVFIPKSDAIYPVLTMLAVWGLLQIVDRRSWRGVLVLGGSLWIGMTLSLAFVAVGFLVLVMAVTELIQSSAAVTERRSGFAWGPLSGSVLLFVGLTGGVWLALRLNLVDVWQANWQNHAGFYAEFPRTYPRWLLVNVLELAGSLGLPLAGMACCGVSAVVCRRAEFLRPGLSVALGWLVTWTVLWGSGKNMGEAARLWLFLMPVIVVTAGQWLAWRSDGTSGARGPLAVLLVGQLLCCVATALRVSGFHFVQWIP